MLSIREWFMQQIDPGVNKKTDSLKVDQTIRDYRLQLSSNQTLSIKEIVRDGPLLLVFIRGTWCPFCNIHLKNLAIWVETLKNKRGTVIVVSSEKLITIKRWLAYNPVGFLFAADPDYELMDYFGVRIPPNQFSQAATFLIDTNLTIRLVYKGKRNPASFEIIESQWEEVLTQS
ncbi:redoxin [Leptospira ryugenii]|uniref:Redoxin n=1 Tax=Leptospira ryugenii TaxID=1917863 RepID=A0A2P2E0H3_9LEPT|nr:redoxin domain-containing protein [Leptospira ryugenii]GBF50372.1 redoxin [Leptospira ryugenii]